jgi:adenine-specific DNA-methyltransferase
MLVGTHENILVYQKYGGYKFVGESRDEKKDGFKNPDNDPRGAWRESNIKSTIKSAADAFTIRDPKTGKEYSNTWAFSRESLERMIQENRILWKDTLPKQKEFMSEMTNENKAIKSYWGVFDAQSTTVYLKKLLPGVKFDNPKPISLMNHLMKVATNPNDIVLDFFAGSGTTGQSVLEANKEDGGNRQFILVTNNEVIESAKNGIAIDITSQRLSRVMRAKHEDSSTEQTTAPLGDNLLVVDLAEVANFEATAGKTPFDVIDETLYGQDKLGVNEKIEWVAKNFEQTQKRLEVK